jgi:hypothetical protein
LRRLQGNWNSGYLEIGPIFIAAGTINHDAAKFLDGTKDLGAKMKKNGMCSMRKAKVRTFRSRLREDLKDPEFKAHYNEERKALKLTMEIIKYPRISKHDEKAH